MSIASKKAYNLAYRYERDWGNCAQATLKALQDLYEETDETVYRGMGSFAGGGGAEGDGMCGAYAGSLFYIGMKYGRRFDDIGKDPGDPEALKIWEKNRELVKEIHKRFIDKYGTVVCHQIQRKLFGRIYYTPDEEQYEEFLKAGGHDWACPSVCGDAAEWTVELFEAQERRINEV